MVAAAVGAAAFGTLVVRGARVPEAAVVAALERALGHPLHVEQARVRFLPRPGLELRGVRAPNAGVVAGCLTAFEAERVRARLAMAPLVRGHAVIDRVDFFGLRVRTVRPAVAPSGPQGEVRPAAAEPGGGRRGRRRGAGARGAEADEAADLRLRRVSVRGGRIQYLDEATSARWALGRIAADVVLPRAGAPGAARAGIDVQAVLRRGGREPLAELATAGAVAWAAGHPRFRGTLASGPFRFGPLRFDGGEGRLAIDPRGAHVDGLVLRLGGGTVAGRARLVLGEEPAVALRVGGGGASLGTAFGENKVAAEGRWEAVLRVQGPAPWRTRARRALHGDGRVAIRDGALVPFEFGAVLLDVLAPLRGREQSQQLRRRYPGLFDDRQLRFGHFGGTLRLQDRRVHTRDLLLAGDGYRAAGRGSVSLNGRLALAVDLGLSPALTRDLLGRGSLAAVMGAAPDGGLTVPLRIEGTVEQPRVRASPQWSRALLRRTLGDRDPGGTLERLLR
jgi:hypothetical protein